MYVWWGYEGERKESELPNWLKEQYFQKYMIAEKTNIDIIEVFDLDSSN